ERDAIHTPAAELGLVGRRDARDAVRRPLFCALECLLVGHANLHTGSGTVSSTSRSPARNSSPSSTTAPLCTSEASPRFQAFAQIAQGTATGSPQHAQGVVGPSW